MTRENKLALVVGFGLILLVGILVSDHFSSVRTLEAAELTQAIDPLAGDAEDDPDLIALRAAVEEPANPVTDPAPMVGGAGSERDRPEENRVTASGVRAIDPTAPPASARPSDGGVRVPAEAIGHVGDRRHRVAPGESLSTICAKHYGDGRLFQALARYNGLDDPDRVRVGHTLRIPDRAVLTGTASPAAPTQAAPVAPAAPARTDGPRLYTVRPGDSLSKIAQDLLGSVARWNTIFDENRDLLDSPDDLRPGMKLRIPSRQG